MSDWFRKNWKILICSSEFMLAAAFWIGGVSVGSDMTVAILLLLLGWVIATLGFLSITKWNWSKKIISFVTVTLIFVGSGYYVGLTHPARIPQEMIKEWGFKDASLFMTVDGKYLSSYKKKYNLLLIGRVPYMDVNKMTDKSIKKSVGYTITDEQISLAVNMIGTPIPNNTLSTGSLTLHMELVLLPKNVSPDKINTLSDVENVGGKIIAGRGGTGPFHPGPAPHTGGG